MHEEILITTWLRLLLQMNQVFANMHFSHWIHPGSPVAGSQGHTVEIRRLQRHPRHSEVVPPRQRNQAGRNKNTNQLPTARGIYLGNLL